MNAAKPRNPTHHALWFDNPADHRHTYGANHPLRFPRVSLARDLLLALDGIDPEQIRQATPVCDCELAALHAPDYVAAVKRAAAGDLRGGDRERYHIATLENPLFPRMWEVSLGAVGATLNALEAALGGTPAFAPPGGLHHAFPDHASGFCFWNDVALAIFRARRRGHRVLYVDLDAHFPDGVEAFVTGWGDPGIGILSLHGDPSFSFPHRGAAQESSLRRRYVPLPRSVGDEAWLAALERGWGDLFPLIAPDLVILQAGADPIATDPLGRLGLTTQGWLTGCRFVIDHAPRILVTGGGGYHPWVVARAWANLFRVLDGQPLLETITPAGRRALEAVAWEPWDDEADEGWMLERMLD